MPNNNWGKKQKTNPNNVKNTLKKCSTKLFYLPSANF